MTFDDVSVGQVIEADYEITGDVVQCFVETFGDRNPLHIDADAARARGFDRPVAQGGILNGFVSHFVGMIFPGDRSLLLSVDLRYLRPNWHGDRLRLQASVRQKVDSARVCVVAIVFRNLTQGDLVTARGLMQVRFIA